MKRFDKSYHYAKQLIDEGRLGQVFQVRCDWENLPLEEKEEVGAEKVFSNSAGKENYHNR